MNSQQKQLTNTKNSSSDLNIDACAFDDWFLDQPGAVQESFHAFSCENYSFIECFLYARFLGYVGNIISCESWIKKKYPKPDHRKMLLMEIEEMREDIRKLRDDIENCSVKRDAGVARIAAMEKELRGTINQVEQYTSVKDRKGLLMAGADRAIRELMFIFKDDPIESPLHEASMSVWARMQLEE
jgi:hypothetical protein